MNAIEQPEPIAVAEIIDTGSRQVQPEPVEEVIDTNRVIQRADDEVADFGVYPDVLVDSEDSIDARTSRLFEAELARIEENKRVE